jgi:1-deoxy-D-xylulose-5-phosphate reductoisomerase
MKKFISILGSTGSVGLNTLKIINKKKKYLKPYLFSSNKNYDLICHQIKKYKPIIYLINDEKVFEKVKKKFIRSGTKIINNLRASDLKKISDITVLAISGIAGLSPTLLMIRKSKKILIANKESIICGWNLIKKNLILYKTKLIPIDSEHFSIFQIIENSKFDQIEKVYLTASGGPFLGFKKKQLSNIKPKHALSHPKWSMGKKISIDSSTLMNKVLEYIEAQKLFNLPKEKLDILIHPESLIHAIVKFKNGLSKFIYHETSMQIPIANAIFDNKINMNTVIKNDNTIKNLSFKIPDSNNYPIIKILKRANEHPSTSIIINASNEVLVDHFLRKKVPFLSIPIIIKEILGDRNYKKYAIRKPKNLKQIYKINSWAKTKTLEKIATKYV